MNSGYLEFFNLSEDPFGITPDSSYFYPSKVHNDILASLDYAVQQKEGFSLIIGEPGTGKTTILKILIEQWKEKAEIALVMTPRLSPEELLQAILDDLNIRLQTANKNEMIKVFRDFLIDRSLAGKRVIVVIDEAQNLSNDSLEELRLLSNLETEKEKLLQIILVGQPEIIRRLSSDNLRQMDQRITIRATLRPLTKAETSDYITFRLMKAGKGSAILDENAQKLIYKQSGGVPRLINLITSRSLMVAFLDTSLRIRKRHVLDALKHTTQSQPKTIRRQRLIVYGAVVFLLLLMTFTAFYYLDNLLNSAAIQSYPSRHASEKMNIALPDKHNETAATLKPAAVRTTGEGQQGNAIVTASTARLRENPSLKADTYGLALQGERLQVIDEWTELNGNKWYKVTIPDGRAGWIAAYLVRFNSPR